MRAAVPMLSLFGGGVGNQLIGGKMAVGSMYPICRECSNILPRRFRHDATSWREMISDRFYTNMDDAEKRKVAREVFAAPGR